MHNTTKRGKTKYKDTWVLEYPWVEPHPSDQYSAKYKVCGTFINVMSIRKSGLKSHATKSDTHKMLVQKNSPQIESFFKNQTKVIIHNLYFKI